MTVEQLESNATAVLELTNSTEKEYKEFRKNVLGDFVKIVGEK